jgi:excisionase family DNA binding protein
MSDRLLTTREVADRLGRSRDFVMGLIRSQRVECVKIGDRYYVPEWSLLELTRPNGETAAAQATAFPEAVYVRGRRVA